MIYLNHKFTIHQERRYFIVVIVFFTIPGCLLLLALLLGAMGRNAWYFCLM